MVRRCLVAVLLTSCGLAPNTGVSRSRLIAASRASPPRVMVLLDTSGSMSLPLDETDPACPAGCGQNAALLCPASCVTRIVAAKTALDALISSVPDARLGFTHYPSDATCGPPTGVDVPVPAGVSDLDVLRTHVQALVPRGGTPTAAALEFVGALPSLQPATDGSPAVVLLVTDGLPNCNDANPVNACAAPNTCPCTVGTCTGAVCATGCLDADRTGQVLAELAARGIDAVVVSFGPDTASAAATSSFESMARSTRRPAAHAQSAAELEQRLADAIATFAPVACAFTLAEPLAAGEHLEVSVGGRVATANEWTWLDSTRVRITGACDDVRFTAVGD